MRKKKTKRKKSKSEKVANPVKISRSKEEKSDDTPKYLKQILKAHRKAVEERLAAAAAKKGTKPLSETLSGKAPPVPQYIQDKMTGENCCAVLRGMAHNEPDRFISRNYFRIHSGLKESTWNQFYGTFHEFKRQAGIVLSRHVHKLEKDIAKHAAADHYRAMSESRRSLDKKYLKPSSKRFQSSLIFSDVHDIECDPFALRVLLETAKIASTVITKVIMGGDLFDLPEFGRYTQDPRNWDVVGRIKFIHEKLLSPLRKILPNAEFIFVEGNHEMRLFRHLSDATPSMKVLLADLHGFDIPKLLGLDTFEINYVGKADLSARAWRESDHKRELEKNFYILHDCFLIHHFEKGKTKNMPGCHGHKHKFQAWPFDSPIFGSYNWYQLGCMHVRQASYTDAQAWSNGFALVHTDINKKRSSFEYIDIKDHVYVGGQPFERRKSEEIL